mmetsp:Transcript_34944/g.87178  ORF Transcript_34944/g.87178 Transcript_34944/m.87178 type:complete len:205 (-) Transcript_34944:1044-1658(-)
MWRTRDCSLPYSACAVSPAPGRRPRCRGSRTLSTRSRPWCDSPRQTHPRAPGAPRRSSSCCGRWPLSSCATTAGPQLSWWAPLRPEVRARGGAARAYVCPVEQALPRLCVVAGETATARTRWRVRRRGVAEATVRAQTLPSCAAEPRHSRPSSRWRSACARPPRWSWSTWWVQTCSAARCPLRTGHSCAASRQRQRAMRPPRRW